MAHTSLSSRLPFRCLNSQITPKPVASSSAIKAYMMSRELYWRGRVHLCDVKARTGNADDYGPERGVAGTGNGYIPQPGAASGYGGYGGFGPYGNIPGERGEGYRPDQIVARALSCFNDQHMQSYRSCDENYRLTESGDIHVPPEYTDQYCSGPCLSETQNILECVDHIVSHFVFYNRATVHDVRETIKSGCSYGPRRGDFNVAEHIRSYENNSYKLAYPLFFGLLTLVLGWNMLF